MLLAPHQPCTSTTGSPVPWASYAMWTPLTLSREMVALLRDDYRGGMKRRNQSSMWSHSQGM